MHLHYLIYTSTPAKIMADDELQQLLNVSREANLRFDVTGMLICLPDSYIQLIEGPRQHINQLYKNIQIDQRHLRVTTLREGAIDRRFFPDWSMAFKKQDAQAHDEYALNLQDDKVLQLFQIMEGQ